jgi:tape measure domain-containing protein
MAETNEFYIKIGADVDDAMSKLNRLSSQLSQLASTTQRSGNRISGSMNSTANAISQAFGAMGLALTTAGIVSGIVGIGKAALTTAAELEQISVSFRVFTGSAEVANNMLADLKNQALNSPMQFQDITKGAQTLLQYGLTAEQVIPTTRMLGDISSGNADRFARLALAFGQVNAAGRLMGQEARQMINAGFNPLKAISEATGQSMATLTQKMHDGQISVKELGDAFIYATSEGGSHYKMAEEQSKTIGGLYAKLAESTTFALGEIGQAMVKAFDLPSAVTGILQFMNDLKTALQSNEAVGQMVAMVIDNIKTSLKLLVAVLIGAINLWQGLAKVFMFMVNNVYAPVINFFANIYKKIFQLVNGIGVLGKALDFIVGKFTKIDNAKPMALPKVDDSVLTGLSETPSKKTSTRKAAEKVEVIAGTDFITKDVGTAIKKFIQENKDAATTISNWWSTSETKRLAELKKNYDKDVAFANKYGLDLVDIEKKYNSERNLIVQKFSEGKVTAREGARKKIIEQSTRDVNDAINKQKGSLQQTFDDLLSSDISNKLRNFGGAIYSASKDLGQDIAVGFGSVFGEVIAGTTNIENAFKSLGAVMLGAIGDYLIKVGSAAIALGLLQEVFSKIFKNPIGEGGKMGVGAGILAVAVGTALKAASGKLSDSAKAVSVASKTSGSSMGGGSGIAQRASGSSFSYGGSSFSTQSIRLAIDLTGAITATQTGYQINKSLETTLRVTGRQ